MEWLTTVLAEDALGGPAALRRTPVQAAAGTAVKLVNLPVTWSARGIDRAVETLRSAGPAFRELVERGGNASEIAAKALSASQNAALRAAERVTRSEGADGAADALHQGRETVGVLDAKELPIKNYDDLNVNDAVAAIKDLTSPRDVRVMIAYEEAHKDRARIVSAAQTRVAAIAKEAVGIS